MKIYNKRYRIENKIKELEESLEKEKKKLKLLQDSCLHPDLKKSWVNGDYYSKGYTLFWCPDCGETNQ